MSPYSEIVFLDRFVGEAGIGPRAKRSGLDRHDADTLRRNLFAKHLGDGLDGELGRAVVPNPVTPRSPATDDMLTIHPLTRGRACPAEPHG